MLSGRAWDIGGMFPEAPCTPELPTGRGGELLSVRLRRAESMDRSIASRMTRILSAAGLRGSMTSRSFGSSGVSTDSIHVFAASPIFADHQSGPTCKTRKVSR
jgi:hypothetical protein